MPSLPITLEAHFIEQQTNFPDASGDFTRLLYDVALCAKIIGKEVRQAELGDIIGSTGEINVQDEEVQKLDVFANRVMYDINAHTGRVCIMGSEETDDPMYIPDKYSAGKYVLMFDPLDGSGNIDINISVGTIFSIHRKISKGDRGTIEDLLQPGYKQVAAGYIVYGSSTIFVYTAGNGVHGFTLDTNIGEFLLSNPDIKIPENMKYYSTNESNYHYWEPSIKKYIDDIKNPANNRNFSSRYVGALVADFHRNLLKGGIFLYPKDTKDPLKPTGKLRLLYEASPLALIAREAGGYASNGTMPILDIQPTDLHQRTPLFIGNKTEVELIEKYIKENNN